MSENAIGIFFIMFQSQLNGYIKCWIDGSDYPDMMTSDEFKLLVKKVNNDDLYFLILDCINTTSIYLWDVMKSTVRRMSPSVSESELANMISEAKKNYIRHNDDIKNPLFGIYYDQSTGTINLEST